MSRVGCETLPPEERAAVLARERQLAERILEDEALRGELDDWTWQPVQNWLLRVAGRLAHETAGLPEDVAAARVETGGWCLRRIAALLSDALRAAVDSPEVAMYLVAALEGGSEPEDQPRGSARA